MHPNTNNIQTHLFNWNAWVEWMCKMKCYENLNSEVFGIWENHWNGRLQAFYNGSITCGYEECPETYTELLTEWSVNLNNEVIPQMQAHNFVSSCSVQNKVYVKGSRRYELSNHLGNVLAVVSDRKIESDEDYFYSGLGSGYKFENGDYIADVDGEYRQNSGPDGVISSYSAEIISANDYYAFGSLMPGRSFSGGEYKFDFNGKENDNEVKGEGNQQDYGMRIQDTRLARFLSIDPLTKKFPMLTPYQYATNNPVLYIDLDGLEGVMPMANYGKGIRVKGFTVNPNDGDIIYKFKIIHESANGISITTDYSIRQNVEKSYTNTAYLIAFTILHPVLTPDVCFLAGVVDPNTGATNTVINAIESNSADNFNSVVGQFSFQINKNSLVDIDNISGSGMGKVFRHQIYSGLLAAIYGKELAQEIGNTNEMGNGGTFGVTKNDGLTGFNDLANNAWGIAKMDQFVLQNGEINSIESFTNYLNFVANSLTKSDDFKDELGYGTNVNFTPNTPGVKQLYETFRVLSSINTGSYDKKDENK